MARPSRHDRPVLLDAALELAVEGGPAAVTMAAVARTAGAPSGSVYHRFPSRSALLTALWDQAVTDFQREFTAAATGSPGDPLRAAATAARTVVQWCASHPRQARVLLHGPAAFDATPSAAGPVDALRQLADRLGAHSPAARERVTVALVDIPYALVRRYLTADGTLPAHAVEVAEQCALALLGGGDQDQSTGLGSGGTAH